MSFHVKNLVNKVKINGNRKPTNSERKVARLKKKLEIIMIDVEDVERIFHTRFTSKTKTRLNEIKPNLDQFLLAHLSDLGRQSIVITIPTIPWNVIRMTEKRPDQFCLTGKRSIWFQGEKLSETKMRLGWIFLVIDTTDTDKVYKGFKKIKWNALPKLNELVYATIVLQLRIEQIATRSTMIGAETFMTEDRTAKGYNTFVMWDNLGGAKVRILNDQYGVTKGIGRVSRIIQRFYPNS